MHEPLQCSAPSTSVDLVRGRDSQFMCTPSLLPLPKPLPSGVPPGSQKEVYLSPPSFLCTRRESPTTPPTSLPPGGLVLLPLLANALEAGSGHHCNVWAVLVSRSNSAPASAAREWPAGASASWLQPLRRLSFVLFGEIGCPLPPPLPLCESLGLRRPRWRLPVSL